MKVIYESVDSGIKNKIIYLLLFIFFGFITLSIVVILIIFIPELLQEGIANDNIIKLLIILFILFGFSSMLIRLIKNILKTSRAEGKIKSIFQFLDIKEDKIYFSIPLKFEEGFFEVKGYRVTGANADYYEVDRKFISTNKEEKMEFELKNEPFLMVVNPFGEGKIYMPGIIICDERFRNDIILYSKPIYSVSFSQKKITATYEGDYAELSVYKTSNGFKGSLYIPGNLTKARKAKIELIGDKDKNIYKKIIESKQSVEFEYKFLEESIVIVSNYKIFSPMILNKKLNIPFLIEGHGTFLLRLTLDIPFKEDIKEELILYTEPGKMNETFLNSEL
jgi:hypothetical protein